VPKVLCVNEFGLLACAQFAFGVHDIPRRDNKSSLCDRMSPQEYPVIATCRCQLASNALPVKVSWHRQTVEEFCNANWWIADKANQSPSLLCMYFIYLSG